MSAADGPGPDNASDTYIGIRDIGILSAQSVLDYFAKEAPRVRVMKPQGTYLIWLDFSDYGLTDDQLFQLLREEAKVVLNRGSDFGQEGKGHARLNVAAPETMVEEICSRIAEVLPK